MAKNITWMNKHFTNVPAVALPQTGGGTALFTDVSDTTTVASDVVKNKVFFASNGSRQVGTALNDFIITLTQDQNGNWQPDCTLEEVVSAFTAGRDVSVIALRYNYGHPTPTPCFCVVMTDDVDGNRVYFSTAIESFDGLSEISVVLTVYLWNELGFSKDSEELFHFTGNATAEASDVADGKIFYNSSGRQVGTAPTGGASVITVADEIDEHGGTVRTITAVDLTGDTVSASTLLKGIRAHDSHGNLIIGTYEP